MEIQKKYQLGLILVDKTNITNAWQTVRRISNEILRVRSWMAANLCQEMSVPVN